LRLGEREGRADVEANPLEHRQGLPAAPSHAASVAMAKIERKNTTSATGKSSAAILMSAGGA
jgi:hypothetical protein